MTYQQLEEIRECWKGEVCMYVASVIGKTWGYHIVTASGFSVDCYYDTEPESYAKIYDNIRRVDFEYLCEHKDNMLIFVAANDRMQEKIKVQLEQAGIQTYVMIGFAFMQQFCESVLDSHNDEVYARYHAIVDDKEYLKRQFLNKMGRELNLEYPQTLNEKIQWLKLYDRNPEYINLVDKYEFKQIVTQMLGEEYVIPTLGIWNSVEEIEWDTLPQKFVLKCTHDSGSAVICTDKTQLDILKVTENLRKALQRNYYWSGREWPYKNIRPRIIAEEYMIDISEGDLRDYKIHCFGGKALYIQVDYDRFVDHRRNIYTPQWEYIHMEFGFRTNKDVQIEKPQDLDRMLQIAELLSKNIPYVRVDLYYANGKIYVGEMTFYHGSGYEYFAPKSMDSVWGEHILLK